MTFNVDSSNATGIETRLWSFFPTLEFGDLAREQSSFWKSLSLRRVLKGNEPMTEKYKAIAAALIAEYCSDRKPDKMFQMAITSALMQAHIDGFDQASEIVQPGVDEKKAVPHA